MTAPETLPTGDYMHQRAGEWLKRADQLLSILDHVPFESQEPPANMATILAFISVEYALKGYLMINKMKIPFHHDLGDLYNRCLAVRKDLEFEKIRPWVENLARYRVDYDFPGILQDNINVNEAQDAIQEARQVYSFILDKTR